MPAVLALPQPGIYGQEHTNLEERDNPEVKMPDHEVSKGMKVGAITGGVAVGTVGAVVGLGVVSLITGAAGGIIGAGFGTGIGAAVGGVRKVKHKVQLSKLNKQLKTQEPVNGQVALCGVRQTQGKAEKKGAFATWAVCQATGAFACAAPDGGEQGGLYTYAGDGSSKRSCEDNCACFLKACIKAGATCESS